MLILTDKHNKRTITMTDLLVLIPLHATGNLLYARTETLRTVAETLCPVWTLR
jgi:hypothetical protein